MMNRYSLDWYSSGITTNGKKSPDFYAHEFGEFVYEFPQFSTLVLSASNRHEAFVSYIEKIQPTFGHPVTDFMDALIDVGIIKKIINREEGARLKTL
jgi:hypothetical protein